MARWVSGHDLGYRRLPWPPPSNSRLEVGIPRHIPPAISHPHLDPACTTCRYWRRKKEKQMANFWRLGDVTAVLFASAGCLAVFRFCFYYSRSIKLDLR